jgi:hypothetical protein
LQGYHNRQRLPRLLAVSVASQFSGVFATSSTRGAVGETASLGMGVLLGKSGTGTYAPGGVISFELRLPKSHGDVESTQGRII